MRTISGRVSALARSQHDTIAVWQLRRMGMGHRQAAALLRGRRRLFRGVYTLGGEAGTLSWLMAAVLAHGPGAAISHVTGLRLCGLIGWEPDTIHVSVPRGGGRRVREGVVVHRRTKPFAVVHRHGIPMLTPAQCLRDATLEPFALYRALEAAAARGIRGEGPIAALQRRVVGVTRSPAEAQLLLLCHEHGIELPLVNQYINGLEADFQWPRARLILEVDGWEWHSERPQFEEDRRRELVHAAAGWQVVRASALHVFTAPELVVAAVVPPLR